MFKKLTTYLTLIALLLTGALFFLPFAGVVGPEGAIIDIMYYEKITYLIVLIMLITGCVISVISHKIPFLQSRVCMLTGLISAGFQIWLTVDFLRWHNELIFSVSMLFPLVIATLEIIASRKALVDGMTVQAAKMIDRNKKRLR
jgi:hypothetical protein